MRAACSCRLWISASPLLALTGGGGFRPLLGQGFKPNIVLPIIPIPVDHPAHLAGGELVEIVLADILQLPAHHLAKTGQLPHHIATLAFEVV